MRTILMMSAIAAVLALGACSKSEQAAANQNLKETAADIKQETHEAVTSPEVKEAGAELKEAGKNAVVIGKGAVAGAKDAIADVKAKNAAKDGTTTTEVTTTTTTTKKTD